jgi:hypothetical protein
MKVAGFLRKVTNRRFGPIDLYGLILVVLSIVMCTLFQKKGHFWGDDFALYIHQAKALTDNQIDKLVQINSFAIDNSSFHTFSPTLAPWGFPFLLAPLYLIFGINIVAFKMLIALFYVLFILSFYRLGIRFHSKNFSFICALILLANPMLASHTSSVQTELPYLFFCTVTLSMAAGYKIDRYRFYKSVSLGLIIFFCYEIRTEGILLLASLLLFQSIELIKNFRIIFQKKGIKWLLIPTITFALTHIIISRFLPNGFVSHVDHYSRISITSIATNFSLYFNAISTFLIPYNNHILSIILLGFMIYGLTLKFFSDTVLVSYTCFILLLYLLWPFHEIRYIYLMVPFVLYFVAFGFLTILQAILTRNYKTIFALITGIIIVSSFVKAGSSLINKPFPSQTSIVGPESKDARAMFDFIKEKSKPTDVIVFFRARAMSLYTNRKSVMIFGADKTRIFDIGNYVVINKKKMCCQIQYTNPFLTSSAFIRHYKQVYENKSFIIYEQNTSRGGGGNYSML